MAKLAILGDINDGQIETLRSAGIRTTGALMKSCAGRKGRREIAKRTGIKEGTLLRWAGQVDLYRIKGVGMDYAILLEAAGYPTSGVLARQDAEDVYRRLAEQNRVAPLVKKLPTRYQVLDWIRNASRLSEMVPFEH